MADQFIICNGTKVLTNQDTNVSILILLLCILALC